MEFWLKQNNDSLRLPVPPPSYGVKTGLNNSSFMVEGFGEISFIGKPKLTEIAPIETFFPKQNYNFCQYTGFPTPQECVNKIEKWRMSGNPIRYIITDTLVNILCTIESFEWKEQDGTGDIYFTLELKEYRLVSAATQQVSSTANSLNFNAANQLITATRTVDKAIPTTYTVKEGDTLYTIAKKLTGDSTDWSLIYAKNPTVDVMNPTVGTVLTI